MPRRRAAGSACRGGVVFVGKKGAVDKTPSLLVGGRRPAHATKQRPAKLAHGHGAVAVGGGRSAHRGRVRGRLRGRLRGNGQGGPSGRLRVRRVLGVVGGLGKKDPDLGRVGLRRDYHQVGRRLGSSGDVVDAGDGRVCGRRGGGGGGDGGSGGVVKEGQGGLLQRWVGWFLGLGHLALRGLLFQRKLLHELCGGDSLLIRECTIRVM